MTAQKVIKVPTERSIPPVIMTNVQAMARTPFTAVDCRMLTILSACRKLFDATLKNSISASRLANASSFCRVAGLNRVRLRISIAPGRSAASSAGWVELIVRPRSGRLGGVALGGELHDHLLRGAAPGKLAVVPPPTHNHDRGAIPKYPGQRGGDNDNRFPLSRRRVEQFEDLALGP